MTDLIRGVAVVIDDRVDRPDKNDAITDLVAQIVESHIPTLKYSELPDVEILRHLSDVCFVLLDWELLTNASEEPLPLGMAQPVGDVLKEENDALNVQFIKELRKHCFAPLFIFSHLGAYAIKPVLRDSGISFEPEESSYIFIHGKNDLKRGSGKEGMPLIEAMKAWIQRHPSMYLLSKWRNGLMDARTGLFWDLYDAHPGWPKSLWEAYDADGDSPSHALMEIIGRNLQSRMSGVELDKSIVTTDVGTPPQKDLRRVLELAMMVPEKSGQLPSNQYASGDLFRSKTNPKQYWLNIRCDCDCIPRGDKDVSSVELYLLPACQRKDKTLRTCFNVTYGLPQGRHDFGLLFPVDGKLLQVKFRDLEKKTVDDLLKKSERIGRVTPPHITHIRQRYALYLQREGLPRIPNEAVL